MSWQQQAEMLGVSILHKLRGCDPGVVREAVRLALREYGRPLPDGPRLTRAVELLRELHETSPHDREAWLNVQATVSVFLKEKP